MDSKLYLVFIDEGQEFDGCMYTVIDEYCDIVKQRTAHGL